MAEGQWYHQYLPDSNLSFEYGPDVAFADDATMLENMNQILGYPVDAESRLPFEDVTHLLPAAAASLSAYYDGDVVELDVPAPQATSQLDVTYTAITQPHLHPPEMTHSGFNDIPLHMAPGLHSSSNTCNTTISQDDITGNANPQQTQYATAEDWNRYRETFTKLYLDENKTLKEVKSIMKEQYGFNATDKMCKKRISDWKLHKNCKHIEKEEVLRLVDSNSRLGVDLGNPRLNGRPVKMHVLERHRKGKRKARSRSPSVRYPQMSVALGSPDFRKLADGSTKAISDGQSAKRARLQAPTCFASISFSRIDDPAEYRSAENLIFQIDQYYRSKLEKDPHTAWDAWAESSYERELEVSYTFQGMRRTCIFDGHANTVFQRYLFAIGCLQDGYPREAWRMMEEGAEMVRPLLILEPSSFLGALLMTGSSSRQNSGEYGAVLQHLKCLLSGMSIIVHGERHPISKACRLLQDLHWKEPIIELAQRKLRDVLKQCLGESHRAWLYAQVDVCRELAEQKRYNEAERSLRNLVEVCERSHGHTAYETCDVRFELAVVYYMMNRHAEAESTLEEVFQYCKKGGRSRYIYLHAKSLQGLTCLARGDYSAAEAHLWSALSVSLLSCGPKDPLTTSNWVEIQNIRSNQQQGDYRTSTPSPQYSQALYELTENPARCFSRPRSSSLPPMDNPDWVANFWDQHLHNG